MTKAVFFSEDFFKHLEEVTAKDQGYGEGRRQEAVWRAQGQGGRGDPQPAEIPAVQEGQRAK